MFGDFQPFLSNVLQSSVLKQPLNNWNWFFGVPATRWVPTTSYKWSYNPTYLQGLFHPTYNWCKWPTFQGIKQFPKSLAWKRANQCRKSPTWGQKWWAMGVPNDSNPLDMTWVPWVILMDLWLSIRLFHGLLPIIPYTTYLGSISSPVYSK